MDLIDIFLFDVLDEGFSTYEEAAFRKYNSLVKLVNLI